MDATKNHPITIRSAFSKNFERILHLPKTNNVQKIELMNPLKLGFLKAISTADAMLFFIE